jgi:hypothetical protein
MRVMPVPAGREGSYEDGFHRMGGGDELLFVGDAATTPELLGPRGHRAIGVVYRPQYEHLGNYVPTVMLRLLSSTTTRRQRPRGECAAGSQRTATRPPSVVNFGAAEALTDERGGRAVHRITEARRF